METCMNQRQQVQDTSTEVSIVFDQSYINKSTKPTQNASKICYININYFFDIIEKLDNINALPSCGFQIVTTTTIRKPYCQFMATYGLKGQTLIHSPDIIQFCLTVFARSACSFPCSNHQSICSCSFFISSRTLSATSCLVRRFCTCPDRFCRRRSTVFLRWSSISALSSGRINFEKSFFKSLTFLVQVFHSSRDIVAACNCRCVCTRWILSST